MDHAAVNQQSKRLPEVGGWVHDGVDVLIGGWAGVGGPLLDESFKLRCCSNVLVLGAGEQVPLVLNGGWVAEWAEAFMTGQASGAAALTHELVRARSESSHGVDESSGVQVVGKVICVFEGVGFEPESVFEAFEAIAVV